jgi:hypothetical protein
MITIALPNYASDIAWLALESLCNQVTNRDWELVIYEDSDLPLGEDYFRAYQDRLAKAGCHGIKYKYSEERVALNQKWIEMMRMSRPDSIGIILQASDDYSEPYRIETAVHAMNKGADWVHSPLAMFYNVKTSKMMLFKMSGATGVNIAISRRAIESMPTDFEKWSGVDSWLFQNMPDDSMVYTDESTNWTHGVFTDGFNRISVARRGYYTNPTDPFYKTQTVLNDLIPIEVCVMLKQACDGW